MYIKRSIWGNFLCFWEVRRVLKERKPKKWTGNGFSWFFFSSSFGLLNNAHKIQTFLGFPRIVCILFVCVYVYLCTVSFDCFGFVFPTSQFFLLLFLNLVTLWTENRLGEYCKQEGNHVGEYFICWRTINQSLYTKTHFFRLNPKDFIPIHFIAPYVY